MKGEIEIFATTGKKLDKNWRTQRTSANVGPILPIFQRL